MKNSTKKDIFFISVKILAFAMTCVLTFTCVISFTRVSGNDNYPAVKDGDLIIGYRPGRDYDRGDVVLYVNDGEKAVGRIVGLPGDVIVLNDTGNLIVNGTNAGLNDLFPTYPAGDIEYPYRVPEDGVFILGDNRARCTDSRSFGAVGLEAVKAKAITILRRRDL